MNNSQLLNALNGYRARHPEETSVTDRFHEFVAAHVDCFQRSLLTGHVTGSAWLVNRADSHVLLTHHRKLNMWVQLGGHADGNPDVLSVALREAHEESGIEQITPVSESIFDLDVHTIPKRGDEPEHLHYDVRFALRAAISDNFIVSDESHDLAWVDIATLSDLTQEESMLRMAHKWLNQRHNA